jgi:acyl carrier protein
MTTMSDAKSPTADEIERWIVGRLPALTGLPPEGINPRWSFERHGVESVSGVALASELGEWLGRRLEPTLVWDYPSIRDLAVALEREADRRAAP